MVFDVTNEESFRNIHGWLESISKHSQGNVAMIMCGNKCDCTDTRTVYVEEARKLAKANGMNYFDVSAKDNTNIDEVFADLMEQVAHRRLGGEAAPARETIKLTPANAAAATSEEKKKKGCC